MNLYRFDEFGNINYGYAGKVFGLTLSELKYFAGVYQTIGQLNPDCSNYKGFFDEEIDTKNIIFGYNFVTPWEK